MATFGYTSVGASSFHSLNGERKGITFQSAYLTTSSSGSWTIPAGVTSIIVECWGAGGVGGGRGTSNGNGGGGGGGAYSRKTFTGLTPGNSISYVSPFQQFGTTGAGADGHVTWFSSNDSDGCVAAGGKGGTSGTPGIGGAGGAAADGYGDVKYSGGDGSDGVGTTTASGAGGGAAGSAANGNNASGTTAGARSMEAGGAGGAGRTSQQAGLEGEQGGGGGGGGLRTSTTNRNGGAGARGTILVHWATGVEGTLDSVSAYMGGSGNVDVKAFVNKMNGSAYGSHSQIATKENLACSGTAHWETFTMANESLTDTDNYILSVTGNTGTAYRINHDTSGLGGLLGEDQTYSSPESPWQVFRADFNATHLLSIYATYTASSSDPKPSVSDATTVSESVSVQVSAPQVNASDATTVGESVSASVSAVGAITTSVSDSVTTGESRNVTVSNSQISVSDGTTVGESRNVTVSAPQINVSDAVGVAESVNVLVSVIGVLVMSVLESVGVSESVSVTVSAPGFIEASVSDGTTVGETVSATVSGGSVNVSDGVTILDVAQAIVSSPQINVSDGTTVGEVVEVEEDVFQVNVDDSSTVGESVGATVSDLFINTSENVTVGESFNIIAGTEYNANPTNYTGINLDQDVFIMQGLPRMSTWGENTRPVNPPLGTYGFNESTGRIEIYTSSGWMDLMKTGLFIGSTAPDSPVEGNLWIDTS